jgi:hypothetical protein
MLVAWRVWYARNEVTHGKSLPPIEGSKNFLCSYLGTLRNIKDLPVEVMIKGKQIMVEAGKAPQTRVKLSVQDKPWSQPPTGWVKLSIDGSFKGDDGSARAGMALRDDLGNTIFTSCRFLLNCESPFEAELRACKEGPDQALVQSTLPIIIETDCSRLVDVVKASTQDRSSLMYLISDIKSLSSQGRACKFVKVERSQIRVSHCLANLAQTNRCTLTWLGSGPDDIV